MRDRNAGRTSEEGGALSSSPRLGCAALSTARFMRLGSIGSSALLTWISLGRKIKSSFMLKQGSVHALWYTPLAPQP